jgi:hypothetical protein
MKTQLIIVFYNGKHNAFEGLRNQYRLVDCPEDELAISEHIKTALNSLPKAGGYVVAKYQGKWLYLCEKNTKNKDRGYDKVLISYHPLADKFTI